MSAGGAGRCAPGWPQSTLRVSIRFKERSTSSQACKFTSDLMVMSSGHAAQPIALAAQHRWNTQPDAPRAPEGYVEALSSRAGA